MSEAAAEPAVAVSREGAVMTLTLNRPRVLNALDRAILESLDRAFRAAAADDTVRALILTGAGRAFCAGGDIKAMQERGPIDEWQWVRQVNELALALAALPKPVVAALNGPVAGGGCGLLLACDLIVAAEGATIAFTQIAMALIPDLGSSYVLPRLVGAHRAKALAFFGDPIDATTAERWGLVNQVVPSGELMATTKRWAERLASQPAGALGLMKLALDPGNSASLRAALEYEAIAQALCFAHPDHTRAVEQFLERRQARTRPDAG